VSEFVENKVVFKGRALETKWLGEAPMGYRPASAETKFSVIMPLTETKSHHVTVKHHSQGAACGMPFLMGEKITVIASLRDDGEFYTSSCTFDAVPEITLLEYFEQGKDIYLPSTWDCSDEQMNNPDDPKNCFFWSIEAENDRREKMKARWNKEWDERQAARKASRVDKQQK